MAENISHDTDEAYMAIALREAEKGLYTAQPNPRVGCVLVKQGRIIGKGFHLQTGFGHAEANALQAVGSEADGATAYVTLEPCSFAGRTPSCADALIKSGITRVVYGMKDPHPKNGGLGLNKLEDAGLQVDGPVLEASAQKLNPGHILKFEKERPFVRLKMAMSLDGKTALANGESKWITGKEARQDVQRLRAKSSAIITGVQTVIDDDPALTVRADEVGVEHAELAAKISRKVVVLDSNNRMPASAKLCANPNLLQVCLVNSSNAALQSVEQVQLPSDGNGRIDLKALLKELAGRDCNEVLFECGASLAGSLIEEGLVDEFVIYLAPKLMGNGGRSLINLKNFSDMAEVPELDITDIRHLGKDIRISAVPKAVKRGK